MLNSGLLVLTQGILIGVSLCLTYLFLLAIASLKSPGISLSSEPKHRFAIARTVVALGAARLVGTECKAIVRETVQLLEDPVAHKEMASVAESSRRWPFQPAHRAGHPGPFRGLFREPLERGK